MSNLNHKDFTRHFPLDANSEAVSLDRRAHCLVEETRRELSLLAAEMMGAQAYYGQFSMRGGKHILDRSEKKVFRDLFEDATLPSLIVDPRPGLNIVDINDAYQSVTMTQRNRISGEKLFEIFPDNPEIADANGVSNLFDSLRKAAQDGLPHGMRLQRYDIRDTSGQFVERYWRLINTPIFDENGRLIYLLHQVTPVPVEEIRNPCRLSNGDHESEATSASDK